MTVKASSKVVYSEKTPPKSQYFSWVSDGLEGATADQTMINLGFFRWLHDEYGMVLDIYTLDAGAIDSCNYYGSVDSQRFKERFPESFGPISRYAGEMGTRLGVWAGPDGFGNTPAEEQKRIKQIVDLCRNYNFIHFKFDGYCTPLRKEKVGAFSRMLEECRKYCPDLIVQNHLLDLYEALPYATTSFWGGAEMYIDVLNGNSVCAPHHRGSTLSRGLVDDMTRLHEDHGTCISSCLDGWDDEMITAAFGRAQLLSPEMYGVPWLLSDDEFPKLARIFNIHRKYGDILVEGKKLRATYGPSAVSRGDSRRRFIVLRNLTWNETSYPVKLDEEIGLAGGKDVEVRQFHPTENEIGVFQFGETVSVKVAPFRSCLLYAGTTRCDEPGVSGVDYSVIRNVPGKPVVLELLGMPGTSANVTVLDANGFKSAKLGGKDAPALLKGPVRVDFGGSSLSQPYHRRIGDMQPVQVPADADALYEATVFAADNNALEVRSILRSGWSSAPAARKAQETFFGEHDFIAHGAWDKNLFDGKRGTGFWPCTRVAGAEQRIDGGCFRLDLGEVAQVDEIVLDAGDEFGMEPLWSYTGYDAYVSEDLVSWRSVRFPAGVKSHIPVNGKMRYLKLSDMPQRLVEVQGFRDGKPLPRVKWRASNLFSANAGFVKKAWRAEFELDEIADGSYLCIAVHGKHGRERAYAAAKIGGAYAGCPDRAPSYPSNVWGYIVMSSDSNYTYYLPLGQSAKGKSIEAYVLAGDAADVKPEVWITTSRPPLKKVKLILE